MAAITLNLQRESPPAAAPTKTDLHELALLKKKLVADLFGRAFEAAAEFDVIVQARYGNGTVHLTELKMLYRHDDEIR